MKSIFRLLLLTVMLRVWWPAHEYGGEKWDAGTGILINVISYGWAYVRTDDGRIIIVKKQSIEKTRWVEVKEEKS